jgi:hypothetical protein
MKIHALLSRFTGSRAAGVLCGGMFTGVLAGLVIAMITIHHETPAYHSSTRIAVEGPDRGASAESKAEWLEELAATLRSRDALSKAARHAEMDKHRGISAEQCAEILERTVSVRVADDHCRIINVMEEPGFVPRKLIYLSNEDSDAKDCARVLNGLAGVLQDKVSALNEQYAQSHPARQQWLALTSQVPPLKKEIAAHEKVLFNAHAGTSGRHLNSAQLLETPPPLIAKEEHAALKAGLEKVAQLQAEAARIEPMAG